jgi:hypothetical protein
LVSSTAKNISITDLHGCKRNKATTMALKVRWSSVFELNLKIIYLSGIVTVLVMCIDGSIPVTEMKVSVKVDSRSDAANINEKQNSEGDGVMKRQSRIFGISSVYLQSSIKSADQEANSSSILKSQSLDENVVTGNQNIKGNRKRTAVTTTHNFWSTLYSSLQNVFSNCSSSTVTHESEKELVKCLKQEAIREFKAMLYTRSRGCFELRREDNYRVGRKANYTDVDQRSHKISLRAKVMPGLFIWMSQREDGLRVGMELDERDIGRTEGEFSQQQKNNNNYNAGSCEHGNAREISGSHCGEYEDNCLLGRYAM